MKRNRRSTKKSAIFFLSLLISILLASSAQAVLVPISQLPDGKIKVFDKEFSEFRVDSITEGGPPELTADTVKVEGVQLGDYYGLRFRVAMSAASDQSINANIYFKITLDDPWLVESAKLWLPTAGATGDGLVTVDELIYDELPGLTLVDELSCSREFGDGGAFQLREDTLEKGGAPAPSDMVWVNLGIIVRGGFPSHNIDNVGTANLTEVYVLYGQIPEPATILLLGLGTLALVRKRRM